MAVRYLSVKNLDRFMHYRDRRPAWVKLYADTLDDWEFMHLSDAAKAHLLLLIVLASQLENRIPYDLGWLATRLGAKSPIDIEELILAGFLEPYDETKAKMRLQTHASRYVSAQTRKNVFALADNKCAECGVEDKLELDFVVPITQGGTADISNLQALCTSCSHRKRVALAQERKAAEPVEVKPAKRRKNKEEGLLTLMELPPIPEPPPSWPSVGYEFWKEHVGVMAISRFAKALSETVKEFGWEATFAGLQEYVRERKGTNKPMRIEWFVSEATLWIKSAQEPTTDEYGDLTEKGKRIAGVK